MTEEKQIEEMGKLCPFYEGGICDLVEGDKRVLCDFNCDMCDFAERLYNADYRKSSEVAREILEELKKAGITEWRYPVIAEIRKKYEVKIDE